jgi:hypothetical protein
MLCPTAPSLPWVAWASLPHLPRYYAPLRLPPPHLRGLRLLLAAPIPCLLRFVRPIRDRLMPWWKQPRHARAFGHPVPHSGYTTRREVALPSSRVTPMATCPALRPRWCPEPLPYRVQDCCLPALANRRLSSPYHGERYPYVHDYTHFGAQSRGLRPRYPRLRTAPYGEARGIATDRLARR